MSAADYIALPRAPETWLIEPLLPTGGSLLLYGDPKVGKSYAALQLASALGSGTDWLGFRCPKPGRVLYIQLDTPRSLWAARVEELTKPTSLGSPLRVSELGRIPQRADSARTHSQPEGSPLDLSGVFLADRETLQTWPFDILNPEHAARLAQVIGAFAPALVILDTLRESHRLDENDSTAMQNVVSRLTSVVKPAALVLVSHGRKSNPEYGPNLINDNRGSNYVVGAVDAIVHFSSKAMDVGGRAIEEAHIGLERTSDHLWQLSDREQTKKLARQLLDDDSLVGVRAKARRLGEITGKSEETCKSIILRAARVVHDPSETGEPEGI